MDDVASIITQQGELARRRKLLEAMQGQNMQTGIQGGGKGYGIGQALAKVATAYMLSQQGKGLAEEEQANRQGYTKALQSGLDDYLTTRDGTGQTVLPAIPGEANQSPTVLPPVVKPNPKEAVVRAMASQMPELQAIGKAELGQLGRKPAQNLKEVNGQLVDLDTGRVVGDYRTKPEEWETTTVAGPDGKPLAAQRNKVTGKIDILDKGTKVNVNTGNGERAAEVALGGQVPKVLEQARNDIMSAQEIRSTAGNVLRLVRDPKTLAGIAAGPGGFLAALGAAAGFTGPEAASQTQQLMSSMAQATLDASKDLKGAISDKDILFLKEAAAGRIQYTPEAIADMATLAMVGAHNKEMRARQQWKGVSGVPGAEAGASMYPLPAYGNFELPEDALVQERPGGLLAYGGRKKGAPVRQPAAAPQGQPKVLSLEEALQFYNRSTP